MRLAALVSGLAIVVSLAGCGKSSNGPSTPTTPTPTGPTADSFNATYTGTATTTDVGFCGLTQVQQFKGVVAVNSTGSGTWTMTQVDPGITFNPANIILSVSNSAGSFAATYIFLNGVSAYQITDTVGITGKTMTVTEVIRGSGGCAFTYTITLTAP